jgi:hypothetical protein
MLEVTSFDGRARAALWQPKEGRSLRSPALLVPQTSLVPAPAWAQATIVAKPSGRGDRIELVSGGTWFHPLDAAAEGLVVPALQPAPTTTVQVLEVGPELAGLHDAGGWASNPKAPPGATRRSRWMAGKVPGDVGKTF